MQGQTTGQGTDRKLDANRLTLMIGCLMPLCYPDRATYREEMDERISRVQGLLDEVSPRLSSHWIESASELLENDEPNEALIQIAWGIASDRIQVPERVLQFIEETVGDPRDLPADVSGKSGTRTRRGPVA
jgi:hypothetical protein